MQEKKRCCSRIHIFPSTPKFPPLCFPASPLSLSSCLHTTHLPSALPHRRVRILGRCWVSTVSQLNKTIWKQSGLVNVPAQSDPCPFVAVEKNGLSERRGRGEEGGGEQRVAHYFSPRVSPYPPTQSRFYRPLSTPHAPRLLSAPFKGEHAIWDRAVCVTVPPRTRCFYFSPSLLFFSLLRHFHLLASHIGF